MPALAPALMVEEIVGVGVGFGGTCSEGEDAAAPAVVVVSLIINDELVEEISGVCIVTVVFAAVELDFA